MADCGNHIDVRIAGTADSLNWERRYSCQQPDQLLQSIDLVLGSRLGGLARNDVGTDSIQGTGSY